VYFLALSKAGDGMHTLVKQIGVKKAFAAEALPLLAAFGMAEGLYKFHSFALETLAFLATWYLFSWGVQNWRALRAK
jgi:hypothetical protein